MIINGKEYKINMNGYTLVLYKQEFHKDIFASLIGMKDSIDVATFIELSWAMAKSYNKNIPSFEEFASSITDIKGVFTKENISEITEVIKGCMKRANEEELKKG